MRIAAILLGSVLFAGAASAQQVPGVVPGGAMDQQGSVAGGATGPIPSVRERSRTIINPVDEAQATAEQLRLKGRCDLAVPTLRAYVGRAGSEIAQYNLGLCLFDLAKTATTPDAAASMRKEGALWLLRSANAGFAQAEAKAAAIYLEGTGVDKDPIEAEKWVLLYQRNAMRNILRMPDLAQDLQDKIDASLGSAGRATAEARADSWGQTYWPAANNE
jgi:TPR repeat protein